MRSHQHLPEHLTFTGIDAQTDFDRVEALSERYPIEWGILYSPTRAGQQNRYPDTSTVARFLWLSRVTAACMRVAVHLCGKAATDVVTDSQTGFLSGTPKGWVGRYQINVARGRGVPSAVEEFSIRRDARGILQCRDGFPADNRVDWLFDTSGGRGLLPDFWPRPPSGQFAGYAGGLGPDTIEEALAGIQKAVPAGNRYWLDMESAIRTDDWLDLDKCEAVCRAVYGAG